MNTRGAILLLSLLGGFAVSVSAASASTAAVVDAAPALKAAPAGSPYAPLVARNMFGLVPIPVHDPAEDVKGPPPPKITPNGIMTIFGKMQVLFKVAQPAAGGQPAKDLSYMMSEGERQDDIEVQKIDEAAATITFNNHGVVETLELVKAAPSAAGGVGTPGGGPMGVMPRLGAGGGGMQPGAVNAPTIIGGRFGRSHGAPAGAPSNSASNSGAPGIGGAAQTASASNGDPQNQEDVSPEARVIMMEAQRSKWINEGNPAAAIIPPTPLTTQVTGEE